MERHRPGYAFWQHIFMIPDGSIAFGSAADGRLLATFPVTGDWSRDAVWYDQALAGTLDDAVLPSSLDERRDFVAQRLESHVGPVLHNPTRGDFLLPNVARYGPFLEGMGRDLRTIRCARRRSGSQSGHPRIGARRHAGARRRAPSASASGSSRTGRSSIGCRRTSSSRATRRRRRRTVRRTCRSWRRDTARSCRRCRSTTAAARTSGGCSSTASASAEATCASDIFSARRPRATCRRLDLYGYRDLYRTYGPRSYLYAEMVFGNT